MQATDSEKLYMCIQVVWGWFSSNGQNGYSIRALNGLFGEITASGLLATVQTSAASRC